MKQADHVYRTRNNIKIKHDFSRYFDLFWQ